LGEDLNNFERMNLGFKQVVSNAGWERTFCAVRDPMAIAIAIPIFGFMRRSRLFFGAGEDYGDRAVRFGDPIPIPIPIWI
jgi:hypothetical protein